MKVVVLDYGSGNLRSATRALAAAGAEVELTDERERARIADRLVVPGVGAFAACMRSLVAIDAGGLIRERMAAGRPTLGICVGHQVLFDSGTEHGQTTPGLGILPGAVARLAARRLPHMGWNTVDADPRSGLFTDSQRYYFVHSYGVGDLAAVRRLDGDPILATATHEGATFLAGIEWGALTSVQFHPEKSGPAGAELLRRWIGQGANCQ